MTNGSQPQSNNFSLNFTHFLQASGSYPKPPMQCETSEMMSGSKSPKGCYLSGEHVVYDVNDWIPVEVHSELVVFPSMFFGNQDIPLKVGSQISANKQYIGYCIQSGTIYVYNRQTKKQCLLQGHQQRVTDMAFCGDQVGLLASASSDGYFFIWSIIETSCKEDDETIKGKISFSIQILGEWELVHPLVCWLNQDLVVGIDKYVLTLTSEELKKKFVSSGFTVNNPIRCHVRNLIRGIKFAGLHDLEVTALTVISRCPTLIASASRDGTVRIWRDEELVPVTRFAPYEGLPVGSVSCLSPLENDLHVILTSGGPENRELKLWVPFDTACLFPAEAIGKWKCIETVELKNSIDRRPCQLFFNRTLRDPEASLLLVGCTQDNSIYMVHVEFEAHSAYMDYLSRFCVELPISNLTARSDKSGDGEGVVEIFCVHDESIQLYTLYRSQCIPPVHNGSSGVSSLTGSYEHPKEVDLSDSYGFYSVERDDCCSPELVGKAELLLPFTRASDCITDPPASSGFGSWIEVPSLLDVLRDVGASQTAYSVSQEKKCAGLSHIDSIATTTAVCQRESVSGRCKDSWKGSRYCPVSSLEKLPETMAVTEFSSCTVPSLSAGRKSHELLPSDGKCYLKVSRSTDSKDYNNEDSYNFSQVSSISDSVYPYVRDSVPTSATDPKVTDKVTTALMFNLSDMKSTVGQTSEFNNLGMSSGMLYSESIAYFSQQARENMKCSKDIVDTIRIESSASSDWKYIDCSSSDGKTDSDQMHGVEIETSTAVMKSSFIGQTSKPAIFNPLETLALCTSSMQASLDTLGKMTEEFQKHISVSVETSLIEESHRLESSIEERLERHLERYADGMPAGYKEDTVSRASNVMQHVVMPVSKNDFFTALCQNVGKDISYLGPAIAKAISTNSDGIAMAIARNMSQKQEIISDLLEKSVASPAGKLILREPQATFCSKTLQESIGSLFQEKVVPLFESLCRTTIESWEILIQERMHIYTTQIQEDLAHHLITIASSLKDTLTMATANLRYVEEDFRECKNRLMDLMHHNAKYSCRRLAGDSNDRRVNDYDDWTSHTDDFLRLVCEGKLEEAFTRVLLLGDISALLWLLNQVDPLKIFASNPIPISQRVLLFIMHQIACNLGKEMPKKLVWIQEAVTAIDPNDPTISYYIRPVLKQVYTCLEMQLIQMSPGSTLVNKIRLILHVINSLLTSCK